MRAIHISLMLYGFIPLMLSYLPFLLINKELGFDKIITVAAKTDTMNGYYTWAKLGYEINTKSELGTVDQVMFDNLMKDNKRKEKTLQELISTNEGAIFWKENGFSFNGVLNLK